MATTLILHISFLTALLSKFGTKILSTFKLLEDNTNFSIILTAKEFFELAKASDCLVITSQNIDNIVKLYSIENTISFTTTFILKIGESYEYLKISENESHLKFMKDYLDDNHFLHQRSFEINDFLKESEDQLITTYEVDLFYSFVKDENIILSKCGLVRANWYEPTYATIEFLDEIGRTYESIYFSNLKNAQKEMRLLKGRYKVNTRVDNKQRACLYYDHKLLKVKVLA